MRVAFISQPFEPVVPPVQGGSLAIWTYRVALVLKELGHDLLIYSRRLPGQRVVEQRDGISYKRFSTSLDEKIALPFRAAERLMGFPLPKRPFFSSTLNYLSYILQIALDLRSQQCDIVHILNFSQFAPVVRMLNPGPKIVLHMQCHWLADLDRAMIAGRLASTDLILACSDHVAERIRHRFPETASRCFTVWNGVDFDQFSSGHDQPAARNGEPRVLFVGRVSPEKGVHILLEAFPDLARQVPGVHLDIVGPPGNAPYEYMVMINDAPEVAALKRFYPGRLHRGSYYTFLQKSLPKRFSDQVHFIGPVHHDQVKDYYRRSHLLANPSLYEAFGMSLVEAMASRIPVVATRVGGMTEIVEHGKTGLLVEAANAQALAEALVAVLKDEELRSSMGEAGFQRALKRYSWKQVAGTLLCHYHHLLESR